MNEKRHDRPIEEIRDIRRRISARFDHDPARLVAYYEKNAGTIPRPADRHCEANR